MRIRRAEESDLDPMIEVFMDAGAWMVRRYAPEQSDGFPGRDPSKFRPLWDHLYGTGAMWVAEDGGPPVGIAAAIIRDGVWFLSLLFVRPEAHGTGIGSALLDESLVWGRGASTFTVVASPTPGAQALYTRRSMFPVWVQQEWEGKDAERPQAPPGVSGMRRADRSWVDALDRDARGIARPEDHAFWSTFAEPIVLRRGEDPLGYAYVARGGRIGPAAVWDAGDFPSLLAAARARGHGKVSLAIPSANWSLLAEAARLGYRLTGSNTFMASARMPDGARYLPAGGALA